MFSTRFWSNGYNDGTEVLLAKLGQGVVENSELLALAKARAEAEEAHGAKLQQLSEQLVPKKDGFARDDGASMRRAYEGLLQQMDEEGRQHRHIAESIDKMVITPFSKWAEGHSDRVKRSKTELKRYIKAYERELSAVHRAQQRYFNRCRLEEDQASNEPQTDTKTNPQRQSSVSSVESPATTDKRVSSDSTVITSAGSSVSHEETSEELVIGSRHYSADESQEIMRRMLNEISQVDTKVPLLGVYDRTVSGAQIVDWLRENTAARSLNEAEISGQKLVNDGFLRLIGQFGSRFLNSSLFFYQWRPHAYEFAGISIAAETGATTAGGLYADLANKWRTTDGSGGQSIRELDQKYRKTVAILDKARLDLELMLFEHLGYLERCERERLAAFKSVLLDFAAAVSNTVPALSASVDKMLLYHEISDVDRDLRFLVENYQTGRYDPKVVVYDNYYSSVDGAPVFGLDLDLRSRADKKRVPLIVSGTLSALDLHYPMMENDAKRIAAWQSPLAENVRETHLARQHLNMAQLTPHMLREYLGTLAPVTIASVLKLYLLELPNSVIGGQFYDLLRGVYTKFSGTAEEKVEARIQSLQNTLSQLTLSHIAVLDAITGHISRLITIANASRADIELIAQRWGSALCRPKNSSPLSLDDVFPEQILLDLLDHREQIFSELKRHAISVLSPQNSVSSSSGSRFRSLSQRTASAPFAEARLRDSYPSASRSSIDMPSSKASPATVTSPAMSTVSVTSLPETTLSRDLTSSEESLTAQLPTEKTRAAEHDSLINRRSREPRRDNVTSTDSDAEPFADAKE